MILGLGAGILAAMLFGVIAVGQAAVIRRRGLFSAPMLAIVAAYLVGWLLHLVAIAELPLYLAQIAVGTSIVFTVVVAAFVIGEPLRREHWAAVVALVLGLTLLALAAGDAGHGSFSPTATLVLYGLLALNALLGWAAWRSTGAWSGVLLGVLAGTAYGASPIATRSLVDPALDLATIAPALSIGLFGSLGFVLYSAALKRTSVTAASSPLVLLQTVIPSVVGLVAFDDRVRAGWWPAGIAAFSVSVAAAVVLCGAEARLDLLEPDDAGAAQPS